MDYTNIYNSIQNTETVPHVIIINLSFTHGSCYILFISLLNWSRLYFTTYFYYFIFITGHKQLQRFLWVIYENDKE